LDSGWDFQWAYSDANWFPGDYYEEVPEYEGWTTFGSTNENGKTTKKVVVPEDGKIKVREVLKTGRIPFSDDKKVEESVSAEFYCHTDVLNYDNGDVIRNAEADATYHCVGFNVPKPGAVKVTKWECPEWVEVYDRWIDEDGNIWYRDTQIDPTEYDCVLGEDYNFGYVDPNHMYPGDGDGDPDDVPLR
jgi:hypothetical protein